MLSVIIAVGENYILCKFDIVSYDSLGMIIFCCRLFLIQIAFGTSGGIAVGRQSGDQLALFSPFLLPPLFFLCHLYGDFFSVSKQIQQCFKKVSHFEFVIAFHSPKTAGSELG